jgi:hypothetical protein
MWDPTPSDSTLGRRGRPGTTPIPQGHDGETLRLSSRSSALVCQRLGQSRVVGGQQTVMTQDILASLGDHRILDVASIITGALASLFGLYGLLGNQNGPLRRLLVAIPGAVLGSVFGYLYDVHAHGAFSSAFGGILHLSLGSFAWGVAVVG